MPTTNQNLESSNPLAINSVSRLLPSLHSPWLMWLISVSFVLFQFCLQLSAGVMIGDLIKTFQLSALEAGILSGSYYFIYVFMQTPAGILVDRIGPRRLLSGGALICGIGCGLFAISPNFSIACFSRILMGAGSSFAFVSTLYLIGKWFPKKRFAIMTGLAETVGMIGTLTGNILLSYVLQNTPWQKALWGASFIAFCLSLLCFSIIRDKVNTTHSSDSTMSLKRFMLSIKWMLNQPGLWINGAYSGLIFSVVTVFSALWSLPYLMLVQHIALSTATFESSFVFVGSAVGGPIMGFLYPRLHNKNLFLAYAGLLSFAVTTWIIYLTPSSIALTSALFFLLGLICSSYVFNYTFAKETTPMQLHATSIGFTNTICMITAPILQPLIGWILYLGVTHQNNTLAETYTVNNYHWALAIIPLNQLIAAVIAFYIPVYKNARRGYRAL